MCLCICLCLLLLSIVNLPLNSTNLWLITLNITKLCITALNRINVSVITLNSTGVWNTALDSVNIFITAIQKQCVYWDVRIELFKVLFSWISSSEVLKIIGFKIALIWKRKSGLIIECICLYSTGLTPCSRGSSNQRLAGEE
jgi:hypothetical protein